MLGEYTLERDSQYSAMSVNIFDDLINSVLDCFSRAFDFENRSSRKEFWYWQVFRILMFLSLELLTGEFTFIYIVFYNIMAKNNVTIFLHLTDEK